MNKLLLFIEIKDLEGLHNNNFHNLLQSIEDVELHVLPLCEDPLGKIKKTIKVNYNGKVSIYSAQQVLHKISSFARNDIISFTGSLRNRVKKVAQRTMELNGQIILKIIGGIQSIQKECQQYNLVDSLSFLCNQTPSSI